MSNFTRRDLLGVGAWLAAMAWARPVSADEPAPFALDEVVDSGHHFFGALSRGFAEAVQEAVRQWGLPNGYIRFGRTDTRAVPPLVERGKGPLHREDAMVAFRLWLSGFQPVSREGGCGGGSPRTEPSFRASAAKHRSVSCLSSTALMQWA
jgi:hypothetical protein